MNRWFATCPKGLEYLLRDELVTLGAQDGDLYAVDSGLSPGDRVVTDGADRLRDGAKVTIPDNSKPPAAGRKAGKAAPGGSPGAADSTNRQRHHRPPQGSPQGSPQSSQTTKP